MTQMKIGYAMRYVGATTIIAAGVAIAGNSSCYDDEISAYACGVVQCNTDGDCDLPVVAINEPVYDTSTPGRRDSTSTTQALCRKTFMKLDSEQKCTIPAECSNTTSSTKKHGAWCPDESKE